MSISTSPSTGRMYGLKRVCSIWSVARSTIYAMRQRRDEERPKRKRGPKTDLSDENLLEAIRTVIKESPFYGEGHGKIYARLRRDHDIKVSPKRVLRLMREYHLLSPHRVSKGQPKRHDGRITTDIPRDMWGTDATKVLTVDDGWVWFFGFIEHWNAECVGWHVCKRGDRFAAIEAFRNAVRTEYGSIKKGIARGLSLRPDHGSQFTSEGFRQETKYFGACLSFSFVGEPETNGVVERFHRTLKEQVIYGRTYRNVKELREAIQKFIELYNEEWLLKKLGYKSPREARRDWEAKNVA